MQNSTYVDIIRPSIRRDAFIFDVMLVIGALLLTVGMGLQFIATFQPGRRE